MNAKQEDVGVLLRYDLDLSFGSNENNFECVVNKAEHCCEAGYYLYMDGTEYGGIIDAVKSDTATGDVTYSGRTWHGMLESKILAPDTGQDYLVLNGEANTVLASLIQRVGLGSLFAASTAASGVTIKAYQMNRYIGAYSGIRKMLREANAKLCCTFTGGKVVLSAAPVVDYTDGLDADIIDFSAKRVKGKVNHLICLGQGELSNRTVVHLYADADGNISQEQTFSGVDEYAAVYDYPSAESAETLIEEGTKRLKELRAQDALSVAFTQTDNLYDVGDIVGAYDGATDVSVSVEITQKIVTVKGGLLTVSYSTDKASTSVSAGTGSSGESGGQTGSIAKDSEMLGGKAPAYYLPARNLLDNSDFRTPINQRGKSSYTGICYTIDRWRTWDENAAVTLHAGEGITLSKILYQYFEPGKLHAGGAYTVAICLGDGAVCCASGTLSTTGFSYFVGNVFALLQQEANGTVFMAIQAASGETVRWAAMYEGEYSASSLPPYVPKGYTQELMECRRYYVKYGDEGQYSYAYTNGYISGFLFAAPMRIAPTIANASALKLSDFSAAVFGNFYVTTANGIVYLNVPAAMSGEWYRLTGLELSADL